MKTDSLKSNQAHCVAGIIMREFIYRYSQKRNFWLFNSVVSVFMFVMTLFLQNASKHSHTGVSALGPYLFLGITAAGLLGAAAPHHYTRHCALFAWLLSSFEGLKLSMEYAVSQQRLPILSTCDSTTLLFTWFKTLPLFKEDTVNNLCLNSNITFAGFTSAQWSILFFMLHLFFSMICLFSQLITFEIKK